MAVVTIGARRARVVPFRRWFPMAVSVWFATVFVLFAFLFAVAGEPPANGSAPSVQVGPADGRVITAPLAVEAR